VDGEGFDFEEGFSQEIRKFVSGLQDDGEGIEVGLVVRSRVRKGIFGG